MCTNNIHVYFHLKKITPLNRNEPDHEKKVIITKATSKGSGEPGNKCSLARSFAILRCVEGVLRRQNSMSLVPLRCFLHLFKETQIGLL